MGWCPGWHSLDGHGAQGVAVAFPLAFLGLISNYGKKDKLGGWCNKMPRAQLLVKLWYSVEMAHQTTAVISCHPFLFPQSSSMGKTEMTVKSEERRKTTAFEILLCFPLPTLQILMCWRVLFSWLCQKVFSLNVFISTQLPRLSCTRLFCSSGSCHGIC